MTDGRLCIENISQLFAHVPHLYIADGHHRAASAVKAGLKRRAENPGFSGSEEYNYFLSVLFPSDELCIYDYNRCVLDMNGYTKDAFLDKIKDGFDITLADRTSCRPGQKNEFGMYCGGSWYRLRAKPCLHSSDPVKGLDVSLLQDYVLGPVLGIEDPKNRLPHPFHRRHPGAERSRRTGRQLRRSGFCHASHFYGRTACSRRRRDAHAAQVHLV